MKHWQIDDVAWGRFDPAQVDPSVVALVKAAAMVERNGTDYGIYLNRIFHDDPDFRGAVDRWSVEEVQHGDALGRWATLADPSWSFEAAFARFRAGYRINLETDASVRGSRSGELVARCIVETGTSSYYTALAEGTQEPALRQVCQLIAADEYRHFKLFYDHLRRYLSRERISTFRRVRIGLGRITESEDDELAYAYHCGNENEAIGYSHDRCLAAYMSRAMDTYEYHHVERGTRMILKTVGLRPSGKISDFSSKLAWRLLQRRQKSMAASLQRVA